MILADWEIEEKEILSPFAKQCPAGVVSYGLTSSGYDIRLDKFFFRYKEGIIDPHKEDLEKLGERFICDGPLVMEPGESLLALSVESFKMPSNVMGICLNKSTWARCFIACHMTPIEPGFIGDVTLELTNLNNRPVRLHPFQGISQVVFFYTNAPKIDYSQKQGIYQHQKQITLPRVRKAPRLIREEFGKVTA